MVTSLVEDAGIVMSEGGVSVDIASPDSRGEAKLTVTSASFAIGKDVVVFVASKIIPGSRPDMEAS